MKSIFQYIATEAAKIQFKKRGEKPTGKNFKHEVFITKVELKHIIKDSVLILMGVLSASFGLKSFLLPSEFLDGGITGISLITASLTNISLSILIVAINIPFILLAFSVVSKQFAIKSIIAIILLAIAIKTITFPEITHDKLLISVFGGFFLGLGIGLAVRGGAVLDGTEVLAVYLSKNTHMTIGGIILIFNIIIFSVAAYVFNIEIALYAILTYMAASKTVDFVVAGIEEYVGVTIMSEHSEEIRISIIEKMGRGCTIYNGKKGYAKSGENLKDTDIVYTLLTRLEVSKLETEIEKIDSKAFIVMHSIKDAKGGMIKKRAI